MINDTIHWGSPLFLISSVDLSTCRVLDHIILVLDHTTPLFCRVSSHCFLGFAEHLSTSGSSSPLSTIVCRVVYSSFFGSVSVLQNARLARGVIKSLYGCRLTWVIKQKPSQWRNANSQSHGSYHVNIQNIFSLDNFSCVCLTVYLCFHHYLADEAV